MLLLFFKLKYSWSSQVVLVVKNIPVNAREVGSISCPEIDAQSLNSSSQPLRLLEDL